MLGYTSGEDVYPNNFSKHKNRHLLFGRCRFLLPYNALEFLA